VSCCTGAQDFRSLWRFHEIHYGVEAHFDRREINIEICSLKSLTSATQHFSYYRRETAIKIVNTVSASIHRCARAGVAPDPP